MAAEQYLSLPATGSGLNLYSGTAVWTYDTPTTASASLPTGIRIVGFTFQSVTPPGTDTNKEVIFNILIDGVTKLQIPYTIRKDTAVGYVLSTPHAIFFPEPYRVPGGSAIAVIAADSVSTFQNYESIRIRYIEDTPPTVALSTPPDVGTVTTTTPAFIFTGTDVNGDDISYNVQIDTSNTFLSGPGGEFLDQVSGNKGWYSAGVNSSNGDIFGCVPGGDIWKQTGGTGSFVAQSAGALNWTDVKINSSNGDVFGCVQAGSIWKQTAGTGSFIDQSAGTQQWFGLAVNPSNGDVFGCVAGGDIWKQTGGTGAFVAQSAGTQQWRGVAVNPSNGDVFGCVNTTGGSIWKQTAGTGSFIDQSAGGRYWMGVAVNPSNGDVFGIVSNGSLYKQKAGTGSFVNQGTALKDWRGLGFNSTTGKACSAAYNGSIWSQEGDALITVISNIDAGFSGTPDNTDPFTSGQAVTYTVQSALTNNTTYYWRVRGLDPLGGNAYGAWATTRSFTVTTGAVAVYNRLGLLGVG